jgi:hypothetical protein
MMVAVQLHLELKYFNAAILIKVKNILVLESPSSTDLPDMGLETKKGTALSWRRFPASMC